MSTDYDEYVDNVVKSFCNQVDKDLQLQKDINVFSKKVITPNIIKLVNSDEVFPAAFHDRKFAFKIKQFHYETKDIFKISVMDLEKYSKYLRLSAGESYKAKTATFEYEKEYELAEQISNALSMLLFDIFGIDVSAQEV